MSSDLKSVFCRHLRSKHYYFLSAVPTTVEDLQDASNYYQCSMTMQCVGPDGERVGPQGCQAQRTCYRSQFEVSA